MEDKFLPEWGLDGFSQDEREKACIEYYDRFGLMPRHMPSTTGVALIRLYASKIGKLSKLHNPGSLGPFTKHGPQAIIWNRKPVFELEMSRLHAWDKRASYLHACDAVMGVGGFGHLRVRRTQTEWMGAEWRNRAGVWRVEWDHQWLENEATGIQKTVWDMVKKREWFYQPMILALIQMGLHFDIAEGFAFGDSSKLLVNWRDRFLEVIKADPSTVSPVLRSMIKATYTQAIGLFGSKKVKDKDSEESFYRPDWRGQIVDTATARMLHNVVKVNSLYPVTPVCVYDDCLYYLADDARPLQDIFGIEKNFASMFRLKGRYDVSSAAAKKTFAAVPAVFARDIKVFAIEGV